MPNPAGPAPGELSASSWSATELRAMSETIAHPQPELVALGGESLNRKECGPAAGDLALACHLCR